MNSKKKETVSGRKSRRRSSVLRQHRKSVTIVCAVLAVLTCTLSVNAVSLYNKNKIYKQQETELRAQIKEEEKRSEEVKAYEEYVKTDEYIKEVAEDKLGLTDPDEIIFKAAE